MVLNQVLHERFKFHITHQTQSFHSVTDGKVSKIPYDIG